MLLGGSGSQLLQGRVIESSEIQCSFLINCAGGASDKVARLIGDESFEIKPRLGDYLLLNRNQVRSRSTQSPISFLTNCNRDRWPIIHYFHAPTLFWEKECWQVLFTSESLALTIYFPLYFVGSNYTLGQSYPRPHST